MYGTHLKASSAMVRLRLYDVLSMLPPHSYESKLHSVLAGRMLSNYSFCKHLLTYFTDQIRKMLQNNLGYCIN